METNIIYKSVKEIDKKKLEELFLSLNWSSGKYPDKLAEALKNYGSVFTAWHGEKLIGLIGTMDDGVMTAYTHYLLVNPVYQGKGIGRKLVEMTKEYYDSYLKIVLVAYTDAIDFYKSCGFEASHDGLPMYITSMDD